MPRRCKGRFDEALLSGLLDGVIAEPDCRIVTAHLATCDECRRLFSDLKEIRQACLSVRFCRSPSRLRTVGGRVVGYH